LKNTLPEKVKTKFSTTDKHLEQLYIEFLLSTRGH